MQRRRTFKDDAAEEPPINLTPLIDVVFVVLIMFIVIAPMLEIDRIALAEAPGRKESVQDKSPLAIYVRADNTIWINDRAIGESQLAEVLKEVRLKAQPQTPPQLFQDKRAQFGTYQLVKNAVEKAGFEELDLILQP